MYHLVYVGVNIGFLFGAASELSFKQSEVPGLVKKQKNPQPTTTKKIPTQHYKGKIKKLILFTLLEDGGKGFKTSISASHNTG